MCAELTPHFEKGGWGGFKKLRIKNEKTTQRVRGFSVKTHYLNLKRVVHTQ